MLTASDDIVLLGLNKTAAYEAESLRNRGNKVMLIGSSSTVTRGTAAYSLSNDPEIQLFVKSLGLPQDQSDKLVNAIKAGDNDIRDEFGKLVEIMANMEKAGKGPSRLIVSGHGTGEDFWGDDNGQFKIDHIKKIAEALPKAAALIQDLHLSACYSGNERDLISWRKAFPNVLTIWAYSDSAPGSYSGATKHLSIWDGATKGGKDLLKRSIAQKTRKGANVAVWSKTLGYQAKESSAIGDLLNRISTSESTYTSYFTGTTNVSDPQQGPLRTYYNDLQELLGHPRATPNQIKTYTVRRESTIRLLYFDKKIKVKFFESHSAQLDSAYRALGKPTPNFSKLSRKDCLSEIDKFELMTKTNSSEEITSAKNLLIMGLKNLDPDFIPVNWI